MVYYKVTINTLPEISKTIRTDSYMNRRLCEASNKCFLSKIQNDNKILEFYKTINKAETSIMCSRYSLLRHSYI